MPAAGTYDVTYFKVGYESQTISTEISQGDITVQDVVLAPITPFSLLVKVEDIFGNPIQNAKIKLEHPLIIYEGETNGLGQEVFSLFYEDLHSLQVGKWGYITECYEDFSLLLDAGTATLTFVLQNGYYDDFTFDFGWTVSGSAETGSWERGIPNPTDNTVMNGDVDVDCGNMAYVTGNAENVDPDFDDVDKGVTVLSSPVMNLSGYSNPALTFYVDFYCNHGPNDIDDTLKFIVSDGTLKMVDFISPQSDEMAWGFFPILLSGLDVSNITISFLVSDLPGNPNITEAALDLFRVEEFSNINEESSQESFSIHPNPTAGEFVISGTQLGAVYKIRSLNGALLEVGIVKNAEHMLEINTFEAGIYLISVDGAQKKIIKY